MSHVAGTAKHWATRIVNALTAYDLQPNCSRQGRNRDRLHVKRRVARYGSDRSACSTVSAGILTLHPDFGLQRGQFCNGINRAMSRGLQLRD
jgi:hypothetical protein